MPGITTYSLGLLLPDGIKRYVALFSTPPAPDGTGGVEVSAAGYARSSIEAWLTTENLDGSWSRSSSDAVEFAGFDFPLASGRIEAVGIYDALVAGNLTLWALCAPLEDFTAAEQVRFVAGTLTFTTVP